MTLGVERETSCVAQASRVDQAMGIDTDPETIAIARSRSTGNGNVEFHTAALTEVASTGDDVVTAIAVVHHLDLSEALKAMRRLTKPGGKLLIVGCLPVRDSVGLSH